MTPTLPLLQNHGYIVPLVKTKLFRLGTNFSDKIGDLEGADGQLW